MYLCISGHMVRRVIAISGSPFADWAVFNDKVTKKTIFAISLKHNCELQI